MPKFLTLIAKINRTENAAPEWMLLFKAGWGELADGTRYLVDESSLSMIQSVIDQRGNEIHFDYEHASLEKTAAPAAGWVKELKWEEGKGILAKVEWTAKAAEFIAAKEYRYFSPVFAVRKSDARVCYLDSVALTNRPKTTHLQPILARLEAGPETDKQKGEPMNREQLIASLGLSAGATDQDILMAVAKLGVKLPEAKEDVKEVIPKAVIAALGLNDTDTETVVVASIHALNQTAKHGVTPEAFKSLQDKIADRDANDAVSAAMAAGKVIPAQKDWAMNYAKNDLEGFNLYVSKAPVVIPVDRLQIKQDKVDGSVMDDAVMNVAKLMDVTEDDLKKYGGLTPVSG